MCVSPLRTVSQFTIALWSFKNASAVRFQGLMYWGSSLRCVLKVRLRDAGFKPYQEKIGL